MTRMIPAERDAQHIVQILGSAELGLEPAQVVPECNPHFQDSQMPARLVEQH